jgi:hypothetical protein
MAYEIIKKYLWFFYLGWHRLLYFFKYGIPILNRPVDSERLISLGDYLKGAHSIAIIGKGASVFHSQPLNIIQSCDHRILMNSVDIEYVQPYIGVKFDLQVSTHVGPINSIIPVLSKKLIDKAGIELIVCNNTLEHKDGKTILNFWNYFNNRAPKIGYMPSERPFFNPDMSQYGERLTMASSILLVLYNVPTIEKIVFVGVDAFHFGYSYRPNVSENNKHFYPINEGGYDDPRTTHGIPFLNFLFSTLEMINKRRILNVYFPEVLKEHIQFPMKEFIKFYP